MRFLVPIAPIAAAGIFGLMLTNPAPGVAQVPVQATASPARGKVLFLRCASCHSTVANAPGKIGPALSGVVGRKGGTLPGYNYSAAMKAKGPIWTEEALDMWLTAPAKVVPGTSMAFVGLANPADRKAVIAYLKTLR